MDDVHSENARLLKSVHVLTADRDDLSHRLQISLQVNDELKSRSSCADVRLERPAPADADVRSSASQELAELHRGFQEATQLVDAQRREM
jgi:hypothetical protein